VAAVAFAALGLSAVPVGANGGSGSYNCNKTVNGGTIDSNVKVTNNGVCVLNGVTVNGNVSVGVNGYFESNGSTISGNVSAGSSLTVYIRNNSNIGGNVAGYLTAQVFVYDSTVGKNVAATSMSAPGYGHFQVCGSTVTRTIGAALMGPDVLIGDPAAGCGGNTVKTGNIEAAYNATDSELHVIGNTVQGWGGDLGIYGNSGAGDKVVTGNSVPKGDIFCLNNSAPFSGAGNLTAGDIEGTQCSANTITGVDADD
jgi:hypothetical protein